MTDAMRVALLELESAVRAVDAYPFVTYDPMTMPTKSLADLLPLKRAVTQALARCDELRAKGDG